MNNNSYHQATKSVPNWKKLSVEMKASYGHWKSTSDATWEAKWIVRVLRCNGRMVNYEYPFENKSDAEVCFRWWQNNNAYAQLILPAPDLEDPNG